MEQETVTSPEIASLSPQIILIEDDIGMQKLFGKIVEKRLANTPPLQILTDPSSLITDFELQLIAELHKNISCQFPNIIICDLNLGSGGNGLNSMIELNNLFIQ